MWIYHQKTGRLDRDREVVAWGYSGRLEGRNNPEMQDRMCIGPIPRGRWHIEEYLPETVTHGPAVLRLRADATCVCYGRSGFLIHGDNRKHDASLGCVILPRTVRDLIWQSGDRELEVVA